jgi:DSF synthase
MQNIAIEAPAPLVRTFANASVVPVPRVRESDPLGSHDDPALSTRWIYLKADAPVKITEEVLSSFRDKRMALKSQIKRDLAAGRDPRLRFMVFASERPGIFSLGGDLKFFKDRIAAGDREGLKNYAKECINMVHDTVTGFGLPLTTIALVRGTAQGGGFEGALAHNVLVAERQSQMGLPEIMFNLFPGMGAYQLLCRRLPPAKAEQLILSGKTYSAEELYEMGVVDILANEGEGEEAVWEYIRKAHSTRNGRDALRRVIQETDSVKYEDLAKSIDVWVEAAFNLEESDLKTMDFLLRAQQRIGY